MKIALETLFFLICFSTVVCQGQGEGGKCKYMPDDAVKADEFALEGKNVIIAKKSKEYECKPGYKLTISLLDFYVCKQTNNAGVIYQYTWEKEIYVCSNTSEVYFGKEEYVDCSASYLVGQDGKRGFKIQRCIPS